MGSLYHMNRPFVERATVFRIAPLGACQTSTLNTVEGLSVGPANRPEERGTTLEMTPFLVVHNSGCLDIFTPSA